MTLRILNEVKRLKTDVSEIRNKLTYKIRLRHLELLISKSNTQTPNRLSFQSILG